MNYDIVDRFEAAVRTRTQNLVHTYLEEAYGVVERQVFQQGRSRVTIFLPGTYHEAVATQAFVKIFIETYTEMGFTVKQVSDFATNGDFEFTV